jgi:chromosome partitioning protein
MGQILTIATSKGGGGKTTLATCLAANLAAQGYRVAVVDADPNATFSDWHSVYEGPAFLCVAEARHIEVVDVAQAQADTHDVVLVDTAGFGNLTAASAMGAADYVLIPCMPDRGSIREALRTAQQADSLARAARRAIPYRIVLTQWREGGLVERATLDELAELPQLAHRLPLLSGFRKASFDGRVPVTGRIGHEADKLLAELARLGAIPALAETAA